RTDERDPLDVGLQRVVLLDGAGDVAGDRRLDRTEAGRVGLIDDPLDVVADLEPRQVAGPRGVGPGEDRQELPIGALVVAVREPRGTAALLDVALELLQIGRRVVLLL